MSRHRRGRRKHHKLALVIKLAVRERDGNACRFCGSGRRLTVHHIRYVCHGSGNEITNLMTLCAACHKNVHRQQY